MLLQRCAVLAACLAISVGLAPSATGEPNPAPTPVNATPVADSARVAPGPPAYLTTPDGWALTLASTDETALPVAPLTTAVSSRDYIVGATFVAALRGPSEARGTLEVGYDIGCGIDMTTSNGVSLTGTTGLTPQLGVSGPVGAFPTTVIPVVATPVGGAITVGLKPGLVNIVPVTKKEFKGNNPWV